MAVIYIHIYIYIYSHGHGSGDAPEAGFVLQEAQQQHGNIYLYLH